MSFLKPETGLHSQQHTILMSVQTGVDPAECCRLESRGGFERKPSPPATLPRTSQTAWSTPENETGVCFSSRTEEASLRYASRRVTRVSTHSLILC